MRKYVVDTNVAIVANGRGIHGGAKAPSLACRMAAVEFLQGLVQSGKFFLDVAGDIQAEYRRHLLPVGQPGVGDRFYLEVINSNPAVVERVILQRLENGEYQILPDLIIKSTFDPSDRKFAALAIQTGSRVVNAVDSDWIHHRELLLNSGVKLKLLCGDCIDNWFE